MKALIIIAACLTLSFLFKILGEVSLRKSLKKATVKSTDTNADFKEALKYYKNLED